MSQTQRKALVIGATGAVGQELINQLSQQNYDITAVVRRRATFHHPVTQLICPSFSDLSGFMQREAGDLSAAQVFSALGTTLKQAGSKDAFRAVDYGYNLAFAKAALKQGARHYLLVSAHGASADSWSFYSKTKGELEEAVAKLHFKSSVFFRPSLLLADHSGRTLESIGVGLIRPLNRFFDQPPLPSVWPIAPQQVARAMVGLSQRCAKQSTGVLRVSNQTMHEGVTP